MKSGPNSSDRNKIYKMLASGAEPEGISAVLGIKVEAIRMYTPEGKKQALEDRAKAGVAAKQKKKDQAVADAKAEAAAEIAAEEEKEMIEQVKKDERAKIKAKKGKAA